MSGEDDPSLEHTRQALETILKNIGMERTEVNSSLGHFEVFFIKYNSAKRFVEYVYGLVDSVPKDLVDGIFSGNPMLVGDSLRRLYETSGVLDLLEKLGLKLRAVIVVTDRKMKNWQRIDKYYIGIPTTEQEIRDIQDYLRKIWRGDDLYSKIAEAAAQHLVYNAAYCKYRGKGNTVIKILIVAKNPDAALNYLTDKKNLANIIDTLLK